MQHRNSPHFSAALQNEKWPFDPTAANITAPMFALPTQLSSKNFVMEVGQLASASRFLLFSMLCYSAPKRKGSWDMWNMEQFVADCRTAVDQDASHKSVAEVVDRAMRDPAGVTQSLGEPAESGIFPIYKSSDLTIVNVVWKPGMTVMPHNHEMWAVIGIYGGREDNIFWRRIADDPDGRIEAAGARALSTGQYAPLGKDLIHSVTNPIPKLTGAIHVYGGDFFEAERSEWDPENLTEHAYDMSKVRALFED